ncbi:uncharacterized protein LOC115885257 [Sitophilus oryzae]|uniref:Uncharacterized protein LOC115885257 n=1 Tax=Sitophilus oryzae TaxID=7048 RepID=A0A6J2YAK6_SITOR|nr:uncharacterized protein LOC115885257 [Sitophilus oryzae]
MAASQQQENTVLVESGLKLEKKLNPNDMVVDVLYPVDDIVTIDGPYGRQTKVYLKSGQVVYLPKRMTLSPETIEGLYPKQKALVCRGYKYVEKYKVSTPLLEIVEDWGQ